MFTTFLYHLINLLFFYIQIIFTVKTTEGILNEKEIILKKSYYN